jgi:hypothetical protein
MRDESYFFFYGKRDDGGEAIWKISELMGRETKVNRLIGSAMKGMQTGWFVDSWHGRGNGN